MTQQSPTSEKYDYSQFTLKELFEIRDSIDMLGKHGFVLYEYREEVEKELELRVEKQMT